MHSNKLAIVTGASRGIGREIAKGLAEDGYNLILIARNKDQLLKLQSELTPYSITSEILNCDIADFENLTKNLEKILRKFNKVDVLINNAGIFIDGTINASLDDYQKLFDVNFKAQLALIQTVIPYMQQQRNGYIFNIASLAGKVGYSGIGAYTSSKFALVGVSESLHDEYASQGIKITSICPSWVATDMASGAPIPENNMIQTRDILHTIRYLLSLTSGAFIKEIVLYTSDK